MEKFISKEMEVMEMEERIHVIREDLTGDALLSAKLVKAAKENNWEEVENCLPTVLIPASAVSEMLSEWNPHSITPSKPNVLMLPKNFTRQATDWMISS